MNLPSRDECLEILKKHHTPQHIIRHSRAVNKIANYLSKELLAAGEDLNQELVDRASLLHDVLRMSDIKGDLFAFTDEADETQDNKNIWQAQREKYHGNHHAQATALLFQDHYPEMAEVIKRHRNSAILDGFENWEQKIVYYADKRVNHDQIVSLDERMAEGKKRWRVKPEQDNSAELLNKMKILEKEIFDKINKIPDVINKI